MPPTTLHHQYIPNWHGSFVDYIGSLFDVVAGLMNPLVREFWKQIQINNHPIWITKAR
ncbi:MAG: hypothetical protein IKP89_10020 [Bacteroidales bacterium]|jgi:hypothetical protein|nr:hypothetical protein [Bacteroidales bacterium]